VIAACLFLAVGCSSPTEIVLVLDSNLAQAGTHWIRVSGTEARCFAVEAGSAELPLTLGISPSEHEQRIEVTAAAFAPAAPLPDCERDAPLDSPIVAQRARARFVTGERRVLFMSLEEACRGVVCEGELSCRAGRCADVDRETDPWTGVFPRIHDAGLVASDAGADGGRDAGADASLDAGAPPPDAGTDAGAPPDAGPCGGAAPRTVLIAAVADTQLPREDCGADSCGGTIAYGSNELLNVGVAHVLLRFPRPPDLDDRLAERLIDARVVIRRVRDHSGCGSCAFDGTIEARAMRTDWIEADGREGAAWCRRNGACEPWNAPGATQVGTDVGPPIAVWVPAAQDVVELPVSDLPAFASSTMAVQLRGIRTDVPDPMQAVFVLLSREGAAARGAAPAQLSLTYCP